MTYEEKKKLIEAMQIMKELCTTNCNRTGTCDCPFASGTYCNAKDIPKEWNIPTITRWTQEDVALAKALKGFGGNFLVRNLTGAIACRFNNGDICDVPVEAFKGMKNDVIALDTIIKEAEG